MSLKGRAVAAVKGPGDGFQQGADGWGNTAATVEKGERNEWGNDRFFACGMECSYRVIRVKQNIEGQALVIFITYFMNVKSDLTDPSGI